MPTNCRIQVATDNKWNFPFLNHYKITAFLYEKQDTNT